RARPLSNRILLVSRLTQIKGAHLAVPAVARASALLSRDLELVVAGEGPEQEAMSIAAARAGLRYRATGFVDAPTRTALMRDSDALLVPSLWSEPFGLVGIEAGCVGLPAVGFGLGGIPDWLRGSEAGERVDGPYTAHALGEALARLLGDKDRHQLA